MRLKSMYLLLLMSFISLFVFSQETNNRSFKVVGYYFLNAALKDTTYADSSYRFLDRITHLNIAFINPDADGNFTRDLAIDSLIKKAHRKKVKVLASIAGGGSHPYYAELLQNHNRETFIKKLIAMVQQYHLDGIDVDLEGRDIGNNYLHFVIELAAALKKKNKLITAAIATAYKDRLPDKALQQFDFVNIMSYDQTGPWRPDDPGDHSPYSMAVKDLNYWHHVRSIPKDKLVLGLPFYGYGFGPGNTPVVSMAYKQIVALYPNSEASDTLTLPGNVVMYFNNKTMIKKKTALALKNAGGVMIWQLLGDAEGDLSLLKAIHEEIITGNTAQ